MRLVCFCWKFGKRKYVMSMIGIFGLCSQSKYETLRKLVKNKQFKETETLVYEINRELRESSEKLDKLI